MTVHRELLKEIYINRVKTGISFDSKALHFLFKPQGQRERKHWVVWGLIKRGNIFNVGD
jgi:hypothetical protein